MFNIPVSKTLQIFYWHNHQSEDWENMTSDTEKELSDNSK